MSLDRIIGQPIAVNILTKAIAQAQIAPAYLFVGLDGTGKRTTLLAFLQSLFPGYTKLRSNLFDRGELGDKGEGEDKEELGDKEKLGDKGEKILCTNATSYYKLAHPDLLWVEPTYTHDGNLVRVSEIDSEFSAKSKPLIRIEQVHELISFLAHPPLSAPYIIGVIEGADCLTSNAAEALLKTLEEPGQRRVLILLATSMRSLLPTIVSRCQIVPFRRLNPDDFQQVLELAGYSGNQDSTLLSLSQGSPGKAKACARKLARIPNAFVKGSQNLNSTPKALMLARAISQELSLELQVFLAEYLQQWFWEKGQGLRVELLEQAINQLNKSTSSRLVWEVALMKCANTKLHSREVNYRTPTLAGSVV